MAIQFAANTSPIPPAKRGTPKHAHPIKAETAHEPARAKPEPKIEPVEKRGRGRPASGNETVTLRISSAVLAYYRVSGEGWQARLNADLIRLCGL